MSLRAMLWAFDNVKMVPAGQTLVLLALADFADEDGTCWPSRQTIADRARMSARSVTRHIKWLEDHGLLSVEGRWDGTRQSTNWYQLALGETWNEGPCPAERAGLIAGVAGSGASAEPATRPDHAQWKRQSKTPGQGRVDNLSPPSVTAEESYPQSAGQSRVANLSRGGDNLSRGDTGVQGEVDSCVHLIEEPPRRNPHPSPPSPHGPSGAGEAPSAGRAPAGAGGAGDDSPPGLTAEPGPGARAADAAGPGPGGTGGSRDDASGGALPAGASAEDWQLVREVVPEAMSGALPPRDVARVAAAIRERLEAGWRKARIRDTLGGRAAPPVVRSMTGLVMARLRDDVPVDGAPPGQATMLVHDSSARTEPAVPASPEPTDAQRAKGRQLLDEWMTNRLARRAGGK